MQYNSADSNNRDLNSLPSLNRVKPAWQKPVTTVLEIDELVLNGGDGNAEGGFSHS